MLQAGVAINLGKMNWPRRGYLIVWVDMRWDNSERTMIHALARFIRSIHWTIGITTLPTDATLQQERSFVLIWVGIVVLVALLLVALVYFLL